MKAFRVMVMMAALSGFAIAQSDTQAQSQTNAGASTNTSIQAGQTGANAQTQTSVSGAQNAGTSRSGAKGQTNATGASQANANGNSPNGTASLGSGTTIEAVLSKSIDAKKVKEGDEVVAKTTREVKGQGERTIPKGSKLIGHVTKASARSKGDSESSLGIMFDRAEIGKGRAVPVHAVIQALAAVNHTSNAAMNMGGDDDMGSPSYSGGGTQSAGGNGGLVGGTLNGAGRTVGNTTGAVGQTAGNVAGGAVGAAGGAINNTTGTAGAAAGSTLNATAQGVVGMPGYTLQAATEATTQGSIITSSGKDVKLDSGTQMVLRVVSE